MAMVEKKIRIRRKKSKLKKIIGELKFLIVLSFICVFIAVYLGLKNDKIIYLVDMVGWK